MSANKNISEINNTKIMEAKEKAKELVGKFTNLDIELGGLTAGYLTMKTNDAKECALICIDECLNALRMIDDSCFEVQAYNFYENVKKEIEQP